MIFLIEFIAFLITLTIPGYLVADKYFQGLEKAVLSVFLSLSVTSFLFYIVVSFFGISKEFIYGYAFLLLIGFFLIKKPKINRIFDSVKKVKLNISPIKREKVFELLLLFLLVFSLSLSAFFIPISNVISADDSIYHLPIINDISENGQKTFFYETHNIYQVMSNQFPLLFESFAGATKFLLNLNLNLLRFVPFFALVLSLFLIYFISRQVGYNEFYSVTLYGLTFIVLNFSRYFGTESFLSLFFLGAVFFVLKYIKNGELFFLGVAGFCSGLMFLTKFTGGIFFVGLLLFFLYKRKFRASFLFGLVFVLVSLIFFVSHFGVPFSLVSVGSYGKLVSENLLTTTFLNVFGVIETFFWGFSNNQYVFFLPLIFFFGLFWKKNRKTVFFELFLISLFLFLFVVFINSTYPTHTGFPRYFLPIYSLLCIFCGIQLKQIITVLKGKSRHFFEIIFILAILFLSINILDNLYLETKSLNYNYHGKGIPNKSNLTVWFVNGFSWILKLDNAKVYDKVWKTDFSGGPCEFLRKNKIDYVVYYNIDHNPDAMKGYYTNNLGEFGLNLRESLFNSECTELFSRVPGWTNNSATFKVIYEE